MNKKILTLLSTAIIISFHDATCQILFLDSTATFVGYWEIGDEKVYRITESKRRIQDDKIVSEEVVRYDSRIKIIEATDTSYTILWRYENFDVKTDNEFLKKLMTLSQDMTVNYNTDELGTFVGVNNWIEIRDWMDMAIDTLSKEFTDIPDFNVIISQVKSTFFSKEAIESAAIKEILLFHNPFGAEYVLNEQYIVDTKLPNIYGGEPFDTKLVVKLTNINSEKEQATLTTLQEVDREQATEAVYQYLKRLAESTGQPGPTRKDIPELTIEDRNTSTIDLITGWVLFTENVREVKTGNVIQLEETRIILK